MVNPVSGLRMNVDLRPLEAGLDPKKLLNPTDPAGLVPVALFNRLDAAPVDWSNCGEHRIIYSFKAPIPNVSGLPSRLLLIFEARTDNASPQKTGFEGCRATANFWRNLTDENDSGKRAERLEQFYYTGIAGASGPVVQAKNYGGPLGQVRGNFFINAPGTQPKWQLREWIVVNSGQPTPASLVPVTVKDNPLAQFYLDGNGSGDDAPKDATLEASERVEFQNQFLGTSITRCWSQTLYATSWRPANQDIVKNSIRRMLLSTKPNTDSISLTASARALKIVSTSSRAFLKALKTTRRQEPEPL